MFPRTPLSRLVVASVLSLSATLPALAVPTKSISTAPPAPSETPLPPAPPGTISQEEFRTLRCAADGQTRYFAGAGEIRARGNATLPDLVLRFVGVDIARCFLNPADGRWYLLSRELTLYQDPVTREVIHEWKNPVSGETVPVIHNANAYQGFPLLPFVPALREGGVTVVNLDFDSRIPNAVFGDPRFDPYMPQQVHSSYESYSFAFSGPSAFLRFNRVGPWLPWMKMGRAPGELIYSLTAFATSDFGSLPEALRTEISERLPLYAEAPSCVLSGKPANSWELFPRLLDSYLARARFPLPALLGSDGCPVEN